MSLSLAYFLLAALCSVAALAPVVAPAATRRFPRSKVGAILVFGAAAGWFLWNLSQIGEADLAGIPREALLGVFGFSAVAAFKLVPDFLAVRGLAGLLLLTASPLLDAGFGKTPQSLLLAALTYVLILFAITVGTAPYLMRDLIDALFAKPARAKAFAAAAGVAAVACVVNGSLV